MTFLNFTVARKLRQVGQHCHVFKKDLKVLTLAAFQITSWGNVAFWVCINLPFLKPKFRISIYLGQIKMNRGD